MPLLKDPKKVLHFFFKEIAARANLIIIRGIQQSSGEVDSYYFLRLWFC